jgi:predicted 3-demethylubiquinone-9 3-methyltransferase (glyoxalase superfamily)
MGAAGFYVELIPNSKLETETSDDSEPLIVNFSLDGAPFQILNGGDHFQLSPACSIAVSTPDQTETDRIWNALIAGGGVESNCGWLVDRWGVSWQVYPQALPELLGSQDRDAAGRAQAAMMKMKKIEIGVMKDAFDTVAA